MIMNDIDYKVLKIIFRNKGKAKIKHIQEELNNYGLEDVSYSTIDSCIKRLYLKDFLIWEKYKPIKISKKGENFAKELIRHSQLLELLLHKELELTPNEAHQESEKFNLLFSCSTINKICKKYEHPKECPCGEKILNSEACCCDRHL
jgi:DtxR family transcriptional regulator, Mn-dependent transcriptional regulator